MLYRKPQSTMNQDPELFESTIPKCHQELDKERLTKEMIFELIRYIKDPEHPYSLETLNVVSLENTNINEIETKYGKNLKKITVLFQPTIPHCSMAAIIGLSIVYVLRTQLDDFWIQVQIVENTHVNWITINKQLDDKDRINAAFENNSIFNFIQDCVESCVT